MATVFHTLTHYNHTPFDLIYPTASDREQGINEINGRTLTAAMTNPPRLALQQDNFSMWLLVNYSPILWVSAGSALPPITSDLTYHVNGTTGDDGNDGSLSTPFETFDRALRDIIGRKITNNATVKIKVTGAGTYTSFPQYVDLDIDLGSQLVIDASGLTPTAIAGPFTVASAVGVGDIGPDFVSMATDLNVSSPGWTANQFFNKTIKMTSGNWNGYHLACKHNGTDYVRVFPDWYGFAAGNTFEIVEEPVIIDVNHFIRFTNKHVENVPRTTGGTALNVSGIRFDCNDSDNGSAIELHQIDSTCSFVTIIGHQTGVEVLRVYDSYVNYIPPNSGVFDGGATLEDYFSMAFGVYGEVGALPSDSYRTVFIRDSSISVVTTSGLFFAAGFENNAIYSHADGVENQSTAFVVIWSMFVDQYVNGAAFYNQSGSFWFTSAWIEKSGIVITSRMGAKNRVAWLKGNAVSVAYAVELAAGSVLRHIGDDITITGATNDAVFLIDSTAVAWATAGTPVRLPATSDDGSRIVRY